MQYSHAAGATVEVAMTRKVPIKAIVKRGEQYPLIIAVNVIIAPKVGVEMVSIVSNGTERWRMRRTRKNSSLCRNERKVYC